MRSRLFIFLLVSMPVLLCGQDTALRFTRAYVVQHQVGWLSWTPQPGATSYQLYRHYPDQGTYSVVASTSDTHYVDTLHRIVCADTVGYYVEALVGGLPRRSDTVGLYFQDNVPTAACRIRLATVDTATRRVVLSWYASPDPDVMGYYICSGTPCYDYDTVWGRLDTVYHCVVDLDCHSEHNFRVLAFDSCYQASPLTSYFHNPVLSLHADSCSRRLRFGWNRYIHMPDSVGRYRLNCRLEDLDTTFVVETGLDGPFAFDTLLEDLAISRVYAWLEVFNSSGTLQALSAVEQFAFYYGDTAAYLHLSAPRYDENIPAVTITVQIDTAFRGRWCYLTRCDDDDTAYHVVATFTRGSRWQPSITYTDTNIRRTARRYVYRLDAPDVCRQRSTLSDTVQLIMPEVSEPAAFFPNIIIPHDPEHGTFCPRYLSPLTTDYSLDIYNRGGLRVFHTDQLNQCWDGTSSDRPVPQGVYVYRARCRHADGSDNIYTGTILLIR